MTPRDLLAVADQCIIQRVLERAQPWLAIPPLMEPLAENLLADLLRACRANATFSLVELDTPRFEFKSAEVQHAPHVALEVLDHVLVPDSQDPPGQHCVPVPHELEIGPVIAGDILDAVGELLTFGEQLPQVAETACYGITAHVDDRGVRQHEMNKPDVAEVVWHFVDEEWHSMT